MAKTHNTSAPASAPATGNPTRRFKQHQQVMHELYKLKVATMKRNVAIDGAKRPIFEDAEHCHFYHSVDSKGQVQDKCTPIGGHFHVITVVTPAHGDEPAVLRCSGPMRLVRDEYDQTIVARFDPTGNDNHTHEIEYRYSEEFKPRILNAAAAQVFAEVTREPTPAPGISG